MKKLHWMKWFSLCAALALALTGVGSAQAAADLGGLSVQETTDGIRIAWSGQVGLSATRQPQVLDASVDDWQTVQIGDRWLPAHLIAVEVTDAQALQSSLVAGGQKQHSALAALTTQRLETSTFTGDAREIAVAAPPTPVGLDGNPAPELARPPDLALPSAPLIVLRQSRFRGRTLAVLAVTPVYEAKGEVRSTTRIQADVSGVRLLTDAPAWQMQHMLSAADKDSARSVAAASALEPTNLQASTANTYVAQVSKAGLQRVPASALGNADLSKVHVYLNGSEIAAQVVGTEIRFYASAPGDRLNSSTGYWLTVESGAGKPMTTRTEQGPFTDPGAAFVYERGIWRDNKLYDPWYAGTDGDHWFAPELSSGAASPSMTISMPKNLPSTTPTGDTKVTVSAVAYKTTNNTLSFTLGGVTANSPVFATALPTDVYSWTFPTAGSAESGLLVLNKVQNVPSVVHVDSVSWERQALLNGTPATFYTLNGNYTYDAALSGKTLYDITNPLNVQIVTPSGTKFRGSAGQAYLISGDGAANLFTPTVAAHAPVVLPQNNDVIYIAPNALLGSGALQPLLNQRAAQGYSPVAVSAEALYDSWAFGQMSPVAIRAFLRYAFNTWTKKPVAVILVGDGTDDPFNYRGLNAGADQNNLNLLPPYLATVDPFAGETACDACYAQLDGEDVVGDGADLMADLWYGRFPVKTVSELQNVVTKIVSYENAPVLLTGENYFNSFRNQQIWIADNYQFATGGTDAAGNFAAFSDRGIGSQPVTSPVNRLYYDPCVYDSANPNKCLLKKNQPVPSYVESNGAAAYTRVKNLMNAGAGLVNYNGHANHQQLAALDDAGGVGGWLYYMLDADNMTNGDKMPIVLQMTCLTGAFQNTSATGTTMDERLLVKRSNGGAIAVWGPSGQGVAHGHDALQRGFYRELWKSPPMSTQLGQLTMAGYTELFVNGGCCMDALQTFVLMGDPMTKARVYAPKGLFMPIMKKNGK